MTIDSSSALSLLAHLRHELRTPLNATIGYSEMLLEELSAADSAALELHKIREDGVKLLALVNTLLNPDSANSKTDKIDLATLGQTISPQLAILPRRILAASEKLLKLDDPEIEADVLKIQSAASNFLKILEDLPHFAQSNPSFTQEPASEANILPEIFVDQQVRREEGENLGKILVADDNPTNRDLLSRQVTAQGYQVATAANGQEVLKMIETGEYDLILLDIIMPEMDGYQVLEFLRESQWRHIPVITISALDRVESAVKCIEMGAEDYLTKPIDRVLLKARIGACLEKKRLRDREARYLEQLDRANQEITSLNQRLQQENIRLSTELEIAKRLQQMILPREKELSQSHDLDIAGFMEPAEEVGGDYYDVLHYNNGVKITIGDVTGHGLESGVLSIMVQTAVRTLMESEETDPTKFFEILNRTIYKNVQRMNSDKNLTFCSIDYHDNRLSLSGQHEEILIVRAGGQVECIDTIDLGFPLGLEESIIDFIASTQIDLNSGDVVVLYTDGITEAENILKEPYGLPRLCAVVRDNWYESATSIKQLVIQDWRHYVGKQKICDDITLVVLKQK
jgi:serine phosphatase RsbU (regulator of sigma subunit)